MHQHDKNSKPNHDILLLLTVKNLKEQSIKKDVEIEQLKESNANKDETLNELKRDFEDLKNQFQQMTNNIETKEKETKHILNEIIENQKQKSQQSIKDIEDLKIFSERTSKLHYILSEVCLRRNTNYNKILFQAKYDQNEEVQKWNEMVNEINEDENECNYLKTLKSSINRYKKTVYSTSYKERLLNFFLTSPLGKSRNNFIRIGCSSSLTKSICVKGFTTIDDFKTEVERNDDGRTFKIQNKFNTCSYYIGDCLNVLFPVGGNTKFYLLHKSNEGEKLLLPNGEKVDIDDIKKYRINSSIVLHKFKIL